MGLQLSLRNRFLRFTPEGVKFVLISIAVGIAAVNTGNNLFYLILGMLLSLIIASGLLSELVVKGLGVKRRLPPYIFARTPCSALLNVTNKKRYLPSFSLDLEEQLDGEKRGGLAYLFRVGPQKTQTQVYRLSFPRRGIHHLQGPHLLTRFPFGLFVKGVMIKEPLEVLVYPRLLPWKEILPEVSPLDEGPWSSPQKGRGEEIFGIREYLPGDTSRDIHWRSTAKLSKPMVKEYEKVGIKKVHIVLDTSLPKELTPLDLDQFEGCVSKTASLAYHLLKKQDFLVGLSLGDEVIPFHRGDGHLHRILRSLALVEPQRGERKQLTPPAADAFTIVFKAKE
ncbi:MAG: DUF58 domain-containing protein [Deltaproteobacteria bacterium]|nr:DUF58 domain-containing protein [Deltaproteobacteria bacterium]